MGFLGSLIGLDQQWQAQNGVLASHLLETASSEEKIQIAMGLIHVMQVGSRNYTESIESILAELSSKTRIIQMNFVAIACASQSILPRLDRTEFERVRNPYLADSTTTLGYIPIVINTCAKQTGIRINWPGNEIKENFLEW